MVCVEHDAVRAMQLIGEAYDAYEQLPVLGKLRSESPVLVRGSGYMRSPVVLVGEAPGADEEKAACPFVGPSGKLLDQLLAETGFPRSLCYVTNVLSYRPKGNRTPYPYEIAASRERLNAEIEAVSPMLVITLGKTARRAMRPDGGGPVAECHGRPEELAPGRMMLPTYHPSAALRDPAILDVMRADLEYLRPFAPGRAAS